MNNQSSDSVFDELLVLQGKKGDQKAFELLYKRWNEKMIRHAFRLVKNHELSRDVAQDAWVAISKGLKSLKVPRHFGPWALRITHFKAVDMIRRERKAVKEWSAPEQEEGKEEKISFLLEKLNTLPEKQKLILTMFYLEKMKVAEISYILDIPPGTVKSRLFHAREKLKQEIKSSHHEK